MSDEMKLTRMDRIVLVNQLRIMEALYPDEAPQLGVQREALERGYELLYSWDFEHVYDGDAKMTADESREVWDTMDMFDAIERAMPEDFDCSRFPTTKFAGYDGNNEAKFMSFARFTVERLKRFEYLPMQRPGHWNSHMPVRDMYRRMLAEWRLTPPAERFDLPLETLERVLGAAAYPGTL